MKRPFIILFLFNTLLFSQSKADSLQLEFNKSTIDTVKIKILHQLYDEYRKNSPGKAKVAVLKSLELSLNAKDIPLQVESYNRYGSYLRTQAKNDSAIYFYNKSLLLAEKANFQKGAWHALNALGYIHLRKGDYEKALEFHIRNLNLSIKNNDDLGMAQSYGGIGGVYNEMGEYAKAMENFVQSSKKHEALGSIKDYAINLSNMGLLQEKLNNFKSAKQYLKQSDSLATLINDQTTRAYVSYVLSRIYTKTGELELAVVNGKKALGFYESLGLKNQAGYASYTLGTIYWKQKRYRNALKAFQKKIDIAAQIKDSVGLSSASKAIGDCYFMLKQFDKAKVNFNRALDIALAIENDNRAVDVYRALSNLYSSTGDYKNAYKNERKHGALKNRISTKEKRDFANEVEAKYQNEKKTEEIALLASQNDLQTLKLNKQKNERKGIVAFAIIMVILASLLYNQYRIKQKANKKLTELDRLKSNFFANISHEFRTPLTLIKGPIEQLEQNPEEKLSVENVKMIRRNTSRVLNLVNQLLDLSKIDEGNLKLEPTEGDIYKSLRAAASSFNSHAAQRNIDYKVQIPQTVLWASFDRDKLEKIVYNLLGNSFKFSGDNSTISFNVNFNEQDLQILVSDSGKGIPEEKLPFIFDRFYQADGGSTKENEGSGIGLSLSKDLIELMDGTITVLSELNKGSFFTVHLPIQEIKIRREKTSEMELQLKKIKSKSEPFILTKTDTRDLPNILLVEDNKDMRHFIREQLIKYYKVQEALNGKEGLQKALGNSPDLIITDLMMPKMDGIELCTALKTDVHTSHIPVIMLTAKAGIDNKIEGLETGADDYLTKPFDVNELLVRAKNLIEQRQKLRELFSSKEVQIDPKKITVTSIDEKFLKQILSLLEDKFSDADFGVPQMQKALAMSKTQLHRKLKALTNEAPGELLRNFRLKRAAHLLSQKADTVTQIAYQVGFNNLSYFVKCFKEIYGVAPSAYPIAGK